MTTVRRAYATYVDEEKDDDDDENDNDNDNNNNKNKIKNMPAHLRSSLARWMLHSQGTHDKWYNMMRDFNHALEHQLSFGKLVIAKRDAEFMTGETSTKFLNLDLHVPR